MHNETDERRRECREMQERIQRNAEKDNKTRNSQNAEGVREK